MLRGGAFKPRTSPYSFQGLGEEGLRLLAAVRAETGLPIVTEVIAPQLVPLVSTYADILQIGARNMQNYALLHAVGEAQRPVLLKRGMMSTIEELLMAAEYILSHGNQRVMLCERGIRTFEPYTRNTLDISAVPLLKQLTHLPVLVDPSHGTGKWELVAAGLAGGRGGRGGWPDHRGPPPPGRGALRRRPVAQTGPLCRADGQPAADRQRGGADAVKPLADCQVTIVGLGLMGGSLAGALRGRCRSVTGVDRQPATVELALARGLIDQGTADLAAGVAQADVVVLATPVRTIVQLVGEIGPLLPTGCLLMDLGSTKAADHRRHGNAAGARPAAGRPPDVRQGVGRHRGRRPCHLPRCQFHPLPAGTDLAGGAGAGAGAGPHGRRHPLLLPADRHDWLVATVSHLPYLLACALVATADATTSADPAAWEIVAGGFRDTSRVAGSDVTMMIDILLTNRTEILNAVRAFQAQLDHLARLVEQAGPAEIEAALGPIRADAQGDVPVSQLIVHPADGPLRGRARVPGDKSISHRALLLGALAEGESHLRNWLPAGDCQATLRCLRALGVEIDAHGDADAGELVIHGRGLHGLRAAGRTAGLRPLGHDHAPAGRAAGRAAFRQPADRRPPTAAPADAPDGRAAAPDGGRDRGSGRARPAGDPRPAAHRLRPDTAGGQRPGQERPAAGRSVRRGAHDRPPARPGPRPHRAHVAGADGRPGWELAFDARSCRLRPAETRQLAPLDAHGPRRPFLGRLSAGGRGAGAGFTDHHPGGGGQPHPHRPAGRAAGDGGRRRPEQPAGRGERAGGRPDGAVRPPAGGRGRRARSSCG